MTDLHPLKFKTIFKDKIWGGEKIKTVLGKDFGDLPNCGETWEISGVKGDISEVSEGFHEGKLLTELIQEYKAELVGDAIYKNYRNEFPLLIKFIDANDDLSIQVHPDDALAKQRHNSFGKTEMWYVLHADEGASLISGFNQSLTKSQYLEYFESGRLDEILNREQVVKDDVFFLPAGRVHTIGKGLMIAEIQQTSDITYRIYDFDREDAEGNKRELHVEEALDAINFEHYDEYKTLYSKESSETQTLVDGQYFTTNRHLIAEKTTLNYPSNDSFVIYVVIEGAGKLNYGSEAPINIQGGEAILLPAIFDQIMIEANQTIKLLEVTAH
jgi:mannose-6-phosphate isomerase